MTIEDAFHTRRWTEPYRWPLKTHSIHDVGSVRTRLWTDLKNALRTVLVEDAFCCPFFVQQTISGSASPIVLPLPVCIPNYLYDVGRIFKALLATNGLGFSVPNSLLNTHSIARSHFQLHTLCWTDL